MAVKTSMPVKGRHVAVRVAVVLLFACPAMPLFAALPGSPQCEATDDATLSISVEDLSVRIVSHDLVVAIPEVSTLEIDEREFAMPLDILAPRAAAAIKQVFLLRSEMEISDQDPPLQSIAIRTTTIAPKGATGSDKHLSAPLGDQGGSEIRMNARLPGVSDDELSRFKRQMFRRDI